MTRRSLSLPPVARLLLFFVSFQCGIIDNVLVHCNSLSEVDRLAEYERRGYKWPLPDEAYIPNTPGWKKLMDDRIRQVEELPTSGDRYEGWLQMITSAAVAPNFTQHGFGLARAPDELVDALRQGIRDGLPTARYESKIDVIEGPQCLFINRPDLTQRVLHELRHYAEEWSGMPLTAFRAYGFRLYQNTSQLYMHIDRPQTHIISFILHIDSSDDAEPWPIFIEDFRGQTHEVILTPGDMLFYESSKCFHGRPKPLNGSWYSSLFVHYFPATGGWVDSDRKMESHYAVPPHWSKRVNPEDRKEEVLEMVGTSMREPNCPNSWCRSQNSIKWSGPGEEGVWIAPTGQKYPFHPKQVVSYHDKEQTVYEYYDDDDDDDFDDDGGASADNDIDDDFDDDYESEDEEHDEL